MDQQAAGEMTQGAGRAPQSSLVAEAQRLTAFFSAHGAANEAKGSLTDEALAALRDGGLLALWIPKCFGGVEAGPIEGLEVIEALSYADGSTGWVLMAAQVAMASAAAYLHPKAATEVFGTRMPIIAGQGAA
ncbi:MAG: acyl-CoA dehydrogenase family protein, partial [Nevskiales bacterium]